MYDDDNNNNNSCSGNHVRYDMSYIHMRYADASRVFSFLRQLVVASVILPSDVVFFSFFFFFPFFFSLIFFGLGACLVFFSAGIPRVHGACEEEDEDETGGAEGVWGWCSGLFYLFFSLRSIFFYMPEYEHDMSVVRETRCRFNQ